MPNFLQSNFFNFYSIPLLFTVPSQQILFQQDQVTVTTTGIDTEYCIGLGSLECRIGSPRTYLNPITDILQKIPYKLSGLSSKIECASQSSSMRLQTVTDKYKCSTPSVHAYDSLSPTNQKTQQNPNCMDTLLIHRAQAHWNTGVKTNPNTDHFLWTFWAYKFSSLVSSPNVERKTIKEALQWDEVKSGRERMPEYCTSSSHGRFIMEGVVPKNKEVTRRTLSAILVRADCCPKMKGDSQNNVQPVVSP